MEKRFFSVREAALYCGVSSRLMYLKVKERSLRFYKVNSKILFDVEDLIEFVTKNEFVTGGELLKQLRKKKMVRS
jgi:excisionase family DNA binding protein